MSTVFDAILKNIPPQSKAVATATPPRTTPCYSAPLSFSYKAELNPKKGLITSYLTVYNDPSTGKAYVDSYLDICDVGFMSKTIADLRRARAAKNDPYLIPYLWQHDRHELIGGIKGLTEEPAGVVYEAQVNMNVQRGREAFSLAEEKMIGSSYGYDPVRFQIMGDIRYLLEIKLHEVSVVSFPANPHATMIDAKSRFYVPHEYGRIAALNAQMHKCFDDLAHLDRRYSSDDDELSVVDLLTQMQQEMKR